MVENISWLVICWSHRSQEKHQVRSGDPLKKIKMLSLVFLLVAVLFVGCSGNSVNQNTFIYGRGSDSVSLDPAQVTDGESLKVTRAIFDTLVTYREEDTEIVPHLAEKWQVSKDGKTWIFKLRKNVKFHDQTPFNAEAVVFNFQRWMDKKHPQHKGGVFPYYAYMFGGYQGDAGHVIKQVSALDEYTVKFELHYPLGPFLANLAMPPFAIASPTAIKKDPVGFNRHPVGTGPFQFVEWKKNDSITLTKNENYWKKGLPKVDKVIFKSIPDNNARFTALKSGEVDLIDGVNPKDALESKKFPQLTLHQQPGMNIAYLAMNMDKKPFDHPKVREALNHAVDKQEIIKSFYFGMGTSATHPIPDFMWGYNDQVKDTEYNLQKAKQLLKEAGFPNGFSTNLYYTTDPRPYMPDAKKVAEFIQAEFEKIGVQVKLVPNSWQEHLEKVKKGEHEMALYGWNGDNGDPDNFLYVLLDKDNTRSPDAGNIAFYRSDELHDLLIQAQRSSDKNERIRLYQKAQEVIKKDHPWVPLVHAQVPILTQNYVKGFTPHPTNLYRLEKISLDQ